MLLENIYPFSFVFLGIIFSVIYIIDGWRSDSNSSKLSESPKIKGIFYAIGGTIIGTLNEIAQSFKDRTFSGNSIENYLFAFTVTTIVLIGFLGLSSFFLALSKVSKCKNIDKRNSTISTSFFLAGKAVLDGPREFMAAIEELDEESKLIKRIERQKDNAIEHLSGFYSSLIININNNKTDIDSFKEYSDKFLDEFRKKILLPKEKFRIGIYYYDKQHDQFAFFTGLAPSIARHSRRPIPSNSIAGHAFNNPYIPHLYVVSNGEISSNTLNAISFYPRGKNHWYETIIVCSVKPPEIRTSATSQTPFLILSVDSSDNLLDNDDEAFITAMVYSQSTAFGNALLATGLQDIDFMTFLSL